MKKILLSLMFATSLLPAGATHLRAGEIHVRQHAIGSYTVYVTIVIYTNTINTNVLFGGEDDWLEFGDGTKMLVPETNNVPRPDLGEGVATASFTVTHTYPASGSYLLSYTEPNRDNGILNMKESVSTRFYVETFITLHPLRLYRTPDPIMPLSYHAPFLNELSYAMGCVDSTGSQVRYAFATPKKDRVTSVLSYRLPENIWIDPYSGLITWDTKFNGTSQQGEYLFAIRVSQRDQNNTLIGYMIRDFAFVLDGAEETTEVMPDDDVDDYGGIFVPLNTSVELKTIASGSASPVSFDVFSELQDLTVTSYDSTSGSKLMKVVKVAMTHMPQLTRNQPYAVTVRYYFEGDDDPFIHDVTYLYHTSEFEYDPVMNVVSEATHRVNVYPNPFNTTLIVEPSNDLPAKVEIRDINGRLQFKTGNKAKPVDTSALASGFYYVIVEQGGSRVVCKVVKE
jgi:hypothetical protein